MVVARRYLARMSEQNVKKVMELERECLGLGGGGGRGDEDENTSEAEEKEEAIVSIAHTPSDVFPVNFINSLQYLEEKKVSGYNRVALAINSPIF